MRFFYWVGSYDIIISYHTMFATIHELFARFDLTNVVKVMHLQPGLDHDVSNAGFKCMLKFIEGRESECNLDDPAADLTIGAIIARAFGFA